MINSWSTRLNVERINQGQPLISADPKGWDNGFTLNPTAVRLERSVRNDELIRHILKRHDLDVPQLSEGVIAVFYRGIPKQIVGHQALRSSVGLAVFTPKFELIERYACPLVAPSDDPMGYDYSGVEDQRITRIGDTFYMVSADTTLICPLSTTSAYAWPYRKTSYTGRSSGRSKETSIIIPTKTPS